MEEKVASIKNQVETFVAKTTAEVEDFRLKYISKKGSLSQLFDDLKTVPAEQKKAAGQMLNELKKLAEAKFKELSESIDTKQEAEVDVDLTLPVIPNKTGNLHPLNLTRYRIIEIFE